MVNTTLPRAMLQKRDSMKIPFKIFGVAILVFAIMALSTLYTTIKVYHVGEEVSELSEIFIPLSNTLANIEIQIVTQQLHVERLQKHQAVVRHIDAKIQNLAAQTISPTSATPSEELETYRQQIAELREHISSEKSNLERVEGKVDESIQSAKDLIVSATDKPITADARTALNSLLPMLVSIDLQHSNLHSQLVVLTVILQREDDALRPKIEELIEREEEQLNQRMAAIWTKIAQFTSATATDTENHQDQALIAGMILTGLSGFFALALSALVIKSMMRPLRQLIDQAKQVQAGDLSGELPISSGDEIGDLTRSFNSMIQGLRRTEEIKEKFGQYVDPRVVSRLISDPGMDLLQGEKKLVSVLFADMANFTGISERFTPAGLVKLINRYLEMMSEPIVEQHGLIDKYIGDAIMAFWTTPFCADNQQASLAVAAALKNSDLIDTLRDELPELTGLRRDLPALGMRTGIATGDAIVGSIGSEKTRNYTIIGDTVNLGARLESANKVYGTTILVCERTCAMASVAFEFRKIDHLIVKGKSEPISIYEPLGHTSTVTPDQLEFRDKFESALETFQRGAWTEARTLFSICNQLDQSDPVTNTYLKRLATIEQDGAPDDWDGVWRLDSK